MIKSIVLHLILRAVEVENIVHFTILNFFVWNSQASDKVLNTGDIFDPVYIYPFNMWDKENGKLFLNKTVALRNCYLFLVMLNVK